MEIIKEENVKVWSLANILLSVAFVLLLASSFLVLYFAPELTDRGYTIKSWSINREDTRSGSYAKLEKQITSTKRSIVDLNSKFEGLTPRQPFIIINTTYNTFKVVNYTDTIRSGVCSTGSYITLKVSDKKQYVFKTPTGVFTVINRRKNPVWVKPDWAFLEEGLPIPPRNSELRIEPGSMGEWALGFGNGYYIHGTLYQRFLGLGVSHGCVRMGDDDINYVANTLQVGSKIYIY